MPLSPVSRRELITRLRGLGFSGPFAGGRHMYMERGSIQVRIPNPHPSDIGLPLLRQILRVGRVSEAEWTEA